MQVKCNFQVEPLEPLEEISPVNYSGIQKPTLPGFGVPTLPSFGSSNLPGLPIQTHGMSYFYTVLPQPDPTRVS